MSVSFCFFASSRSSPLIYGVILNTRYGILDGWANYQRGLVAVFLSSTFSKFTSRIERPTILSLNESDWLQFGSQIWISGQFLSYTRRRTFSEVAPVAQNFMIKTQS